MHNKFKRKDKESQEYTLREGNNRFDTVRYENLFAPNRNTSCSNTASDWNQACVQRIGGRELDEC